ncbi:(2Fe-2S)-binding protein [Luteipulveratus halotolerans]|uniref:Ferric siderophore reductase C-terminal domain-containing protein n=1 Tax=Luteipulveratus halotolerans TaxID=1631356 RepID=A0A0L6CF23_9MICO|nr:(2Fe-2S)-binding protein [Luteipulveratus halotolerans]KNX36175.1 hypothetical protein VV01_01855 [Luteipulveratus halotolerans]
MSTRASRTSGWLSVVVGTLDLECAAVLGEQRAGGDPTAAWRAACERDLARQHGVGVVPSSVAATFVLQWYVGALATGFAHLTLATPHLLDLTPSRLSIGLSSPGGYADRLGLVPGEAPAYVPLLADRLDRVEREFRSHASDFATSYDPGVKMSSQHRVGSVEDAWQSAWAGASRAVLGRTSPDRWRASCCFIYALPGAHECARCPRLRSAG